MGGGGGGLFVSWEGGMGHFIKHCMATCSVLGLLLPPAGSTMGGTRYCLALSIVGIYAAARSALHGTKQRRQRAYAYCGYKKARWRYRQERGGGGGGGGGGGTRPSRARAKYSSSTVPYSYHQNDCLKRRAGDSVRVTGHKHIAHRTPAAAPHAIPRLCARLASAPLLARLPPALNARCIS